MHMAAGEGIRIGKVYHVDVVLDTLGSRHTLLDIQLAQQSCRPGCFQLFYLPPNW